MYERIQKMPGWLKPEVEPIKRKDGYTCVITLRKENKQDRSNPFTIRMEPKEPGARLACESSLHAKHWGATYVLFRLFNHLGLHRVLPPGPREYWLELESVKAQAPESDAWKWAADPFEAIAKRDAEAEAREKEKAAREAAKNDPSKKPMSKAWQRAQEVRMAPALRELVENTIRARMSELPITTETNTVRDKMASLSLDKKALERELSALGVRPGYIRRVLAWLEDARTKYASSAAQEQLQKAHPLLSSILALPNREAALEYIVLYTPEQDLPVKLRPTASSESFVTMAASGSDQEQLVDRWTVDKLSRCAGFPRENIARALAAVREAEVTDSIPAREGLVLDLLLHQLMGAHYALSQARLCEPDEALTQKRADERALLLACMSDDDVRSVPDKDAIHAEDYDVHIGTHEGEDVYLRVTLHPMSHYLENGAALPTIYVTSSKLPTFLRLALTRHAMQCLCGKRADIRETLEAEEGGVLFLLCEELKEQLPTFLNDPPALDEVMEHLVEAAPTTAARAIHQTEATRPTAVPRKGGPRAARPLQREAHVDETLQATQQRCYASASYRDSIGRVRESLPAFAAREKLLETLRTQRVVLIAGETGCGKTTQVPQFLLDDAIERGCGSLCSIVVTQPRRVSAMGVAARVAAERGETLDASMKDDQQVGYAIRGERRAGRGCRLLFTTTGVLLRRMATGVDPHLQSISHVIVDEVHERSTDSDFLLLLLRDVLVKNPHLHVVLMSATIQADTFTSYFDGAPYFFIPGRTFPVQDHYLEDIVRYTSYRSAYPTSRVDERIEALYDATDMDEDAMRTMRTLVSSPRIDYDLLAQTVAYACERATKVDGTGSLRGCAAILVFCPGVGEIRQAMDAIAALQLRDIVLLPLHANLPASEQRRVFQPVGARQRKVVVSTNVAETSITIPEVCYVIDTGRVREAQYDAQAGVTRLLDAWASRAACKQRAGRAGRTMPGECFRLYTRVVEAQHQRAQSVPEIQRTPLEGVVLQVKALQPKGDVKAFLQKAIDPPSMDALEATHTRLVIAGALHAEGGYSATLTPLGRHLATLPLDVRQGKMLVLACLFECVEPLLHVVTLLSTRPMVAGSMQHDTSATQARAQFLIGQSDLLTQAHLLATWLRMRFEKAPMRQQRQFCDTHGLSLQALQEMELTRATLLRQLEEVGLVDRAYVQGYREQGPRWPTQASSLSYDTHSQNINVLRSLLLAALWPSVVRVDAPSAKYNASASGAVLKEAQAKELHYFDEQDGRVFLHPSSLLFHATKYKSNYVVAFQKSASGAADAARTYLRDVTEVPLYALLLFGGPLYVDHEVGGMTISTGMEPSADAWVRVRANSRIGVLCRQLRQLLDRALEEGVEDPHAWVSASHQEVVRVMMALVSQDGLESTTSAPGP
ncbi:putative ATP-dependent RNA helicase Ucp12 [Malassezia pachydermatis]